MSRHYQSILALSNFQNTCRIHIRHKRFASVQDIILDRRKDKLLYGNLIETPSQRRKNLQQQKKKGFRYVSETNNNAEPLWVLANSNIQITDGADNLNNQELNIIDQVNRRQSLSKSLTKLCPKLYKHVKSCNYVTEEVTKKKSVSDILMKKAVADKSENIDYPSDYILKHMQSFMICQRKAIKFPDAGTNEILSINPEDEGRPLSHIPSVTRVLRYTMSENSKLALEKWQQNLISTLGEEGFKKYSEELLKNAKALHVCLENALRGETVTVPKEINAAYESMQHVLENISEVKAIESHVMHSTLCYRGIVDCVATYRDKLYVIDWKNSIKKRENILQTYDAPIQIASYIGAINSSQCYPFVVNAGLVVVGYMSGEPADVYEIDAKQVIRYWKKWLKRLQQYYIAKGNEKSEK